MAAAPCSLVHLSGIALKHVATSYGIEPHQDREALLQDITGHLLQTLPYRLAIDRFPSSQSVAGYGFSLAAYSGLIYLFGGRNGLIDSPTDLMSHDPSSGGDWAVVEDRSAQAVPSRRWHSAYVRGDRMVVVGGQVWNEESWLDTSSVIAFDFITRAWCDLITQQGDQPTPRAKCASALIGSQLYMLSGDDARTSSYGTISTFDLDEGEGAWRSRACSGQVPDSKCVEGMVGYEGSIYAIAAEKTAECLQVYRLDSSTMIWSRLGTSGPAPTSRQQFALACYESDWIISGGVLAGTQAVLGGMYAFSFSTAAWSVVVEALPHEGDDLTKRACHTAAVLGSQLYTTGGWHGGWPRLLDGIVLSKQYLPPDEEPCAAALAAPSAAAAAAAAAAAGSGSLAAAGASGGVPNCELPRLVARCRRDQLAFADVVLVAADGTEFECHKVVLAAQSPVFHSMLQADMQEAATGRVAIGDISAPALDALLHYLYGGCSCLEPTITLELFAAADMYCIEGLKKEAILHMRQCLEVDNVALVAQLAAVHDLQSLWQACVAFTSSFKVQSLVFASRAYSEMWVSSPAAAQDFTTQVASSAADSFQQQLAAGGGGSTGGARATAGGILPLKRGRGSG